MVLVIGFAELLGATLLLVSAVSGASFADVITGKAAQKYRQNATSPDSAPAVSDTAGAGAVPGTPSGGFTRQSWAAALLAALGISPTQQAISNIVAWETQEGGHWNNSATYNPLNTTQHAPGSSVMGGGSSAGVQAYTSWTEGLQATVQTLHNGDYGGILSNLGAPLGQFKNAVDSSPWGTVF
jgi:hypothetical protein